LVKKAVVLRLICTVGVPESIVQYPGRFVELQYSNEPSINRFPVVFVPAPELDSYVDVSTDTLAEAPDPDSSLDPKSGSVLKENVSSPSVAPPDCASVVQ
jgi:hypothetical protein